MKAIATNTGEYITSTHVVWIRTLQSLDHLPDHVVEELVEIGVAEYASQPKIKRRPKVGPTEFKDQ